MAGGTGERETARLPRPASRMQIARPPPLTVGPKGAASPCRQSPSSCVTAASASRAVAVALSVVGPRTTYAGSGSWFASRTGPASVVVSGVSAGLIALVGSIVAGTPVLLLGAVVGSVAALLASMWLARLRDGVDGDLLGAAIEIAFALLLVAIVLAT